MTANYQAKATRTVIIPFKERPFQAKLFEGLWGYRFLTAVCHRRFGKTVAAAIWLIKEALQGEEDFRGYYIAPNQKQAKRVVWGYFRTFLKNFGSLVNFNETELRIDFPNGQQIYLVGAENVESLRGIYLDATVMDEMASWTNASYAFYEVLYPAMQDRNGKGLIIGTVKGLDMFFDFYKLGQDDEFPEWNSVMFKLSETGIFSEKVQQQMRTLMERKEPGSYDREMECNFFAKTSEVIITPEEYYMSMMNKVNHLTARNFPLVYGYDPGYTIDPAALVKRKGPIMFKPTMIKNKNSTYQADFIYDEYQRDKPNYIYIDAGQGEGVITNLRNKGLSHVVIPVWFNGKSPKPSCFNKRSYMYLGYKEWLSWGIAPDDDGLLKESTNQLLDKQDSDNRIKLLDKKSISKLIGHSPNKSDAAALTFAGGGFEQLSTEQRAATASSPEEAVRILMRELQDQASDDYDPCNYLNKEM
jgi:hypothetical protein